MKTMLIVDDSACSRTQIRLSVEKLKIVVVGEAENGEEGVAKFISLKPDIVTMDLSMENGDGLEAIKKIMLINSDAVIIIISSVGGQGMIVKEGLEAGAKKVFDKPFKSAKFAKYISEIIS
jgi:two-component system chemotaxis response regulator CheY